MLAVGRALMGKPKLLMLDEPSLGLAPKMIDELLGIVRRICDDGVTILLVEQNVAKAMAIAEGAYVIERGVVVMKGQARKLLKSERLRAAYLGAETKPGTLTWKGGLFMAETADHGSDDRRGERVEGQDIHRPLADGEGRHARGDRAGHRQGADRGRLRRRRGRARGGEGRRRGAGRMGQHRPPTSAPPCCAARRSCSKRTPTRCAPGSCARPGAIPPKADFELHMVTGILLEAAAIATQPPGMMLPSRPEAHELRAARAARRRRRDLAVQLRR